MTDYSDEQKMRNYAMLMNALQHYETRQRVTEDWMEDHKTMIVRIRDFYPNISLANLDIQDRQFRNIADDSEMILSHLISEIQTDKTFTIDLYYKLCKNIKKMFELALQVDDLSELLSNCMNF